MGHKFSTTAIVFHLGSHKECQSQLGQICFQKNEMIEEKYKARKYVI